MSAIEAGDRSLLYNGRGISLLESGKYAEATGAFGEATKLAPDWAYPRHNLALTYIEMGSYSTAVKEYRDAIRRTPFYPYLHYNLGLLFQRLNRKREAAQEYKRAVNKFDLHIQNLGKQIEAWEKQPLSPDIATALEDSADRKKRLLENKAEVRNALGALRAEQRKRREARMQYEEATGLQPAHAGAWYNLGLLEYELYRRSKNRARLEVAATYWRRSVQAQPDYAPSLLRLGKAHLEGISGQNFQEAEQLFRRALAKTTGSAEAQEGLAEALAAQGRLAEAIAEFRRLIETQIRERIQQGIVREEATAAWRLHERVGDLLISSGAPQIEACDEYRRAEKALHQTAHLEEVNRKELRKKASRCP